MTHEARQRSRKAGPRGPIATAVILSRHIHVSDDVTAGWSCPVSSTPPLRQSVPPYCNGHDVLWRDRLAARWDLWYDGLLGWLDLSQSKGFDARFDSARFFVKPSGQLGQIHLVAKKARARRWQARRRCLRDQDGDVRKLGQPSAIRGAELGSLQAYAMHQTGRYLNAPSSVG